MLSVQDMPIGSGAQREEGRRQGVRGQGLGRGTPGAVPDHRARGGGGGGVCRFQASARTWLGCSSGLGYLVLSSSIIVVVNRRRYSGIYMVGSRHPPSALGLGERVFAGLVLGGFFPRD
jgi:hypothetical protein